MREKEQAGCLRNGDAAVLMLMEECGLCCSPLNQQPPAPAVCVCGDACVCGERVWGEGRYYPAVGGGRGNEKKGNGKRKKERK